MNSSISRCFEKYASRPAAVGYILGILGIALVITSPALRAQSSGSGVNLRPANIRLPFVMAIGPGSSTTYTVPNSFGSLVSTDSNYGVGTNLVIKQISVIYAGPIGSSLYVQMITCYEASAIANNSVSADHQLCPSMNFQTPQISGTTPPYVTASFPVTANVPYKIAYTNSGQLSFNFCQYPAGSCSSSPPAGTNVTVVGYFEPF